MTFRHDDGFRHHHPVILRLANTWLTLVVGGGPTEDKPTVTLSTPTDQDNACGFMNFPGGRHCTHIQGMVGAGRAIPERTDRPRDRDPRNIRDPDGHLIEVGRLRR